ncbi:cryptochrome [Vibrio astriarenae]|nr:cryptochrome [Vibrio sp. C7]
MQKVNIVWFKRDLRVEDHEPLNAAVSSRYPTLLLYLFEAILLDNPHYSTLHWRFIYQSLEDLNKRLHALDTSICMMQGETVDCFEYLHSVFDIQGVYSHQEIGLKCTHERDVQLSDWLSSKDIKWSESPSGAVIRGAKTRHQWDKHWKEVMRKPIPKLTATSCDFVTPPPIPKPYQAIIPTEWTLKKSGVQTGGATLAQITLEDFFQRRGKRYYCSISNPSDSRTACSRLSPYLAWGNLSLRQVYQTLLEHWQQPGFRRSLMALSFRLHWHCHFIQKFESEAEMEFRCLNKAYEPLLAKHCKNNATLLMAWKNGQTGIPLVDACMRCLIHTGYINFRMRAMLVSVLTHHMNIDWRLGAPYLASLFLDFEPGIHYPQFQMQAGVTGINTLRIYNPIKQAKEHDSEGEFVRKWIPELTHIPTPLIFEPSQLTEMEVEMYQLEKGSVYLNPVINLDECARKARERLWSRRGRADVKQEAKRILQVHVHPH